MVFYAAHTDSPSTPTLYCLAEAGASAGPGTPRQVTRTTVRQLTQPLAHVSYCSVTQQLVAVSAGAVLTVFALQAGGGGPATWTPLATVQLRQTTEAGAVAVVWLGPAVLGCLHSASDVLSMYDLQAEEQQHLSAGMVGWWVGWAPS